MLRIDSFCEIALMKASIASAGTPAARAER
jgi:hypothetical protein